MLYIIKNKQFTLLLWAISLFVIGCQNPEATDDGHDDAHEEKAEMVELSPAQMAQTHIEIGTTAMQNIGKSIRVSGTIEVPPKGNISINIPYGGYLKYTNMLPGTLVKKGALLAEIENPDFIQFQQDYLEAVARRDFLKAEYTRQEELFTEKVSSAKNFQEAKSNYLSNEARIRGAAERLKLIGFDMSQLQQGKVSASVKIYSPIAGTVRTVHTNIGKYIQPQDVIMDLTNADDLHVELTVYEEDVPKVQKGQQITFTIANSPELLRTAEVFLVGSNIRENRSATVHGHIRGEDSELLPGTFVAANIIISSEKVMALPDAAIVLYSGKNYVFIDKGTEAETKNHLFEMVEVQIKGSESGYTYAESINKAVQLDSQKIVIKEASTLFAKAKNSESAGGHAH